MGANGLGAASLEGAVVNLVLVTFNLYRGMNGGTNTMACISVHHTDNRSALGCGFGCSVNQGKLGKLVVVCTGDIQALDVFDQDYRVIA